MSNPMFASMAQNLMSNPEQLQGTEPDRVCSDLAD